MVSTDAHGRLISLPLDGLTLKGFFTTRLFKKFDVVFLHPFWSPRPVTTFDAEYIVYVSYISLEDHFCFSLYFCPSLLATWDSSSPSLVAFVRVSARCSSPRSSRPSSFLSLDSSVLHLFLQARFSVCSLSTCKRFLSFFLFNLFIAYLSW